MENKLNMPIGTRLKCVLIDNTVKGIELGKEYIFDGYHEKEVPVNRQNAVMTWYPDRPIWTPEEYEDIRARFMQVKLVGIEKPQGLRFFEVIS